MLFLRPFEGAGIYISISYGFLRWKLRSDFCFPLCQAVLALQEAAEAYLVGLFEAELMAKKILRIHGTNGIFTYYYPTIFTIQINQFM